MSDEHQVDRCSVCGQQDNHPKFHVIGPSPDGLGWNTMHHDCAASQGHEHAALIVKESKGAKGEELRSILQNKEHPVHRAVQKAIDDFHAESLKRAKENS